MNRGFLTITYANRTVRHEEEKNWCAIRENRPRTVLVVIKIIIFVTFLDVHWRREGEHREWGGHMKWPIMSRWKIRRRKKISTLLISNKSVSHSSILCQENANENVCKPHKIRIDKSTLSPYTMDMSTAANRKYWRVHLICLIRVRNFRCIYPEGVPFVFLSLHYRQSDLGHQKSVHCGQRNSSQLHFFSTWEWLSACLRCWTRSIVQFHGDKPVFQRSFIKRGKLKIYVNVKLNGVKHGVEQYSGWHYHLWTDEENEVFVRTRFPWFYPTYKQIVPGDSSCW